jgi:trk system potassium uptake protein TrkA
MRDASSTLNGVKLVIVGCGRVGSGVAKQLAEEGWDVTCVDEDEGALARLGEWRGGFVVGHGMDLDVLERAGIASADAAVVATNGDNTNVVVGQVVQRRYAPACVVVRVLDPRRAAFYAERGLRTVCPTQTAIATLTDVVRSSESSAVGTSG